MRLLRSLSIAPIFLPIATAAPSLYGSDQLVIDNELWDEVAGPNSTKVDVTLYVMSRCPDARLCEDVFEDVLKYSGIQDKVNFNLQFIAHENKSEPLGISCKHGQAECAGNIHDLCLQKHLPLPDFYASLACQNFESPFPGKIGDVKLTRRCAEASKVDWWKSGVGQCIQGQKAEKDNGQKAAEKGKLGREGRDLFFESVKVVRERKIEKSCTIDIGEPGKRRCVVDGGVWTGCDDGHTAPDFIRVIQQEWNDLQTEQ